MTDKANLPDGDRIEDTTKNAFRDGSIETSEKRNTVGRNDNTSSTLSSGKRAKNKKRREAQQDFTHSWMIGALKGHTGPVLDINFSSTGKFLASSAEGK